jgi:hypothetical protein
VYITLLWFSLVCLDRYGTVKSGYQTFFPALDSYVEISLFFLQSTSVVLRQGGAAVVKLEWCCCQWCHGVVTIAVHASCMHIRRQSHAYPKFTLATIYLSARAKNQSWERDKPMMFIRLVMQPACNTELTSLTTWSVNFTFRLMPSVPRDVDHWVKY